jgi:hypothetical protein
MARRTNRRSELSLFMAPRAAFTTAIQRVDYPIHQGKPNPAHGKFYFVGSIPGACYDAARNGGAGGSKFYDSEPDAIRAAIAGGADRIQGTDCRFINRADYV